MQNYINASPKFQPFYVNLNHYGYQKKFLAQIVGLKISKTLLKVNMLYL